MALHDLTGHVHAALRKRGRFMDIPREQVSLILQIHDELSDRTTAPWPRDQFHDAQNLKPTDVVVPVHERTEPARIAPKGPVGRYWREKGSETWHGPFVNDDEGAFDAYLAKANHIEFQELPLTTHAVPALAVPADVPHTTPTPGGA